MPITRLQSARDFLRIWFFWKNKAILVFLIIVIGTIVYAYTETPIYQSTAKIIILPKTKQELIVTAGEDQRELLGSVTTEDVNTEMELIKSNEVIERTLKSLKKSASDLQPPPPGPIKQMIADARAAVFAFFREVGLMRPPLPEFESRLISLRGAISVERPAESNVIFVSFKGKKPEQTTDILKRLLGFYLEHRNSVYSLAEGYRFYQDQSDVFRGNLETAEKRLLDLQDEWQIADLDSQIRANVDLLNEFGKELQKLEIQYAESKRSIEIIREGLAGRGAEVLTMTRQMQEIPSVIELEKGIAPLLVKRSEIAKFFTPQSREFREINSQIESLRDEIRYEIRKALRTDELELETMRVKMNSLRQKVATLSRETAELNQKNQQMTTLTRDLDFQKKNYLLYTSKSQDARVNAERNSRNLANVSIAEEPRVPIRPIFPQRMLMIALSLFFGSIAALFTPFLLESIDTRLKTIDDVQAMLAQPVIGTFSETRG